MLCLFRQLQSYSKCIQYCSLSNYIIYSLQHIYVITLVLFKSLSCHACKNQKCIPKQRKTFISHIKDVCYARKGKQVLDIRREKCKINVCSCVQGSQFFFSQNIPGYLQILSRSKKPFSRLYFKQFLHQKEDAKGVQNSQKYKTWKQLPQYNIEMLYILTFQVLSSLSAKFLVLSRFFDILG